MFFRVCLVLAIAVALPWASANEEERVFKGYTVQDFNTKPLFSVGREVDKERKLKALSGVQHLTDFNSNPLWKIGREVDDERKLKALSGVQHLTDFNSNPLWKIGREVDDERTLKKGTYSLQILRPFGVGREVDSERKLKALSGVQHLTDFNSNPLWKIGREVDDERALKKGTYSLQILRPFGVGREVDKERKLKALSGVQHLTDFNSNPLWKIGREVDDERALKKGTYSTLQILRPIGIGREVDSERKLKGLSGSLQIQDFNSRPFGIGREENDERTLKKGTYSTLQILRPFGIGREVDSERKLKGLSGSLQIQDFNSRPFGIGREEDDS